MRILCFAHVGEQLGASSLDLDLAPMTVANLLHVLKERYPQLQLEHVMVAVNEQFAHEADLIQPHDVVALIPPVSGG